MNKAMTMVLAALAAFAGFSEDVRTDPAGNVYARFGSLDRWNSFVATNVVEGLPRSGGDMTGPLNMGFNPITFNGSTNSSEWALWDMLRVWPTGAEGPVSLPFFITNAIAKEVGGVLDDHVADTDNPHGVTSAQVGALPISGGTLTGDLAVGEDHTVSSKLTVSADKDVEGITLQGGKYPGIGSSVTVGGSSGGGGEIRIQGGGSIGGRLYVNGYDGAGGGAIEVSGMGASIKKDGSEVATETYVNTRVSGVESTLTTLAGAVNLKADKSDLEAHVWDYENPHVVTAEQTGAVPLVEDVNREKTAVTIGSHAGTVGPYSLANGNNVTASGGYSHAEGSETKATASYSHAEGDNTFAKGVGSHAEGFVTTASGDYSHAEGYGTIAAADYSYAGGHASMTLPGDSDSFAWSGVVPEDDTKYNSHGPGTFNINPGGGVDGFYIGEQTLSQVISGAVSGKADVENVYTKAESDARISAVSNRAEEAYSAAEDMVDAVNSLAGTIGTHTRDKNNPHKVTAAQVGALPLSGGTLTGQLNINDSMIVMNGYQSSIHVWGDDGPPGVDVTSSGIYILGKRAATEAYVDDKVRKAVLPTDPTFSNAVLSVGLGIDTNSVAVLNEIAETFGGFPLGAGETATTIGGLLAALAAASAWLKKNKADKATTLSGYGITDAATEASLAPEYSPSSAYSVGAFVFHDGNIYQCTTAIADGGEAWNAAHWELRKLDDFFTESNSSLNGRLAYERNETGLKDRAFNALTFDGTEYNLSTALAAVTPTASGQPRDLLIVATATAATTISFTAGTIKGDKPTIDGSGTWLITLTEYASGVWYCRQIKMEDAA